MFFKKNTLHEKSKFSKLDSYAVLLKVIAWKAERLHSEFQSCFIVSDYDDELEAIGCYLIDKDIAHFSEPEQMMEFVKKTVNTVFEKFIG